MIDDLYGIALALEIFLAKKYYPRKSDELHELPFSTKKRIIVHTLDGSNRQILRMEPAPFHKDSSQLNVEFYFRTTKFQEVSGTAIRLANLVNTYFPQYGLLFFPFRSEKLAPSWFMINMESFAKWKTGQISFEEFFKEVFANSLLWPRVWRRYRSDTLSRCLRTCSIVLKALKQKAIPEASERFRKSIDPYYKMYYTSNFEDKSIKQAKRVQADVILLPSQFSGDQLIGIVTSAIKYIRKRKTYRNSMNQTKYGRRKADYVWIDLFCDAVRAIGARNERRLQNRIAIAEYFSGIKGLEWVYIRKDFEQINSNLRIKLLLNDSSA